MTNDLLSPPFRRGLAAAALVAAVAALMAAPPMARAAASPEQIRVPAGFHIDLLTDRVPNARAMALGRWDDGAARGTVYVGSYGAGKVHAVGTAAARAATASSASSSKVPLR